jgi:predicted transcriptional regulator
MQMMAHNPKIAKEHGMKPTAAKEYVSENKGSEAYSELPEKASKFNKLKSYLSKKGK